MSRPDRLTEVLRTLHHTRRPAVAASRLDAAPSLVEVGLRLAALEREVGEVRARVNGVLFAVVASVLAQFVSKVVA